MRKTFLNLLLIAALLLVSVTPAFAQDEPAVPDTNPAAFLPLLINGAGQLEVTTDTTVANASAAAGMTAASVRPGAAIAAGDLLDSVVSPRLKNATGRVQLVIRMSAPSVAETVAASQAGAADAGVQAAAVQAAAAEQGSLLQYILQTDKNAKVLANLRVALNAVIVETDAALIEGIAARPGVTSINPVVNFEQDLSETVPYIGAAAAQAAGVTGAGVRVAVLDSGIDYTHRNLGGAGTDEAYVAAFGTDATDPRNTTRDGLFPTAKVVEGYDFVGEDWPTFGDLKPDDDPIDNGYDAGGHGTHVADIIAGKSLDGLHKGVAPDASLLAVKVCSSVSTSCSGVALLQGMEFALDPNGDQNISDAVDVINMSLGNSYGQREDDLSLASTNAVKAGVVVVTSAGNSADRPYIVGSPSTTPEVISVAQTQVPSAKTYPLVINSPASIAGVYKNTETVDWAPIGAGFSGDVAQVGRGCPAGSVAVDSPEDPYLANPAGKVALIDRGACSISLKVDRAAKAGAIGVLLGLAASGDAVSFSNGGGDTFVPTLVIIKSYADAIKANIGAPVNVTVSPANAVALVGAMVGSSARGPSYSYNAIKPDIGAPGGSVSALVGTGTGEEAFSGTSGAAPMVAGSAALVLSKYPSASPLEVKARLMNTGDTNIQINPATQPGVLAPITRIGGGEVRVDQALKTSIVAWDRKDGIPSLSFGYQALMFDGLFAKQVRVTNYGPTDRWLTVTPSFRYADDQASGAVKILTTSRILVRAGRSETFPVVMYVNARKLPTWTLDGGAQGGTGSTLQSVEFDGYLTLSDAKGSIHLPWQILPRKSAAVQAFVADGGWHAQDAGAAAVDTGGKGGSKSQIVKLFNAGVENGDASSYALLGTSPRIEKKFLPGPGDNFAIVDLRAVGARYVGSAGGSLGDVMEVGITTYGIRSHPAYPAEFDVYLDVNSDGTNDYVAYTAENGTFASTGQTLVWYADINPADGTKSTTAYFYADADLNSANMRMYVPLGYMGATQASKITMSVYAYDNYFTGARTDAIEGIVFTPSTPKFGPLDDFAPLAPWSATTFKPVRIAGGDVASPSQTGLLLLYRSQAPGFEADIVKVK